MKAVHPVHPKTTPRAQQKREKEEMRLEDKSGTLGLLVTTKLEVLASLEGELRGISIGESQLLVVQHTCALVLHCVHSRRRTTFLVVFALCDLSACAQCSDEDESYLVEDGLGLTSVTGLLAVITTLTLREQRGLSCLVLCQFLSGCIQDGVAGD